MKVPAVVLHVLPARLISIEAPVKQIKEADFSAAFRKALADANTLLRPDVEAYLKELRARVSERNTAPVDVFVENAVCAREEKRSLCQDTGYVQIYLKLGQEVHLEFPFEETVNRLIAEVYGKEFYRMSIADPITRENTRSNTPAFVNVQLAAGEVFEVMILLKGGGSENVTKAGCLLPTDSSEAIRAWVKEAVRLAGSKACPPYLIGVGIGGTLEKAVGLSKKLLLEPIGSSSEVPRLKQLEEDCRKDIETLGIGFQGLGFGETVMNLRVGTLPCHIATLPIALSIGCNSVRQAEFEL